MSGTGLNQRSQGARCDPFTMTMEGLRNWGTKGTHMEEVSIFSVGQSGQGALHPRGGGMESERLQFRVVREVAPLSFVLLIFMNKLYTQCVWCCVLVEVGARCTLKHTHTHTHTHTHAHVWCIRGYESLRRTPPQDPSPGPTPQDPSQDPSQGPPPQDPSQGPSR